MVEERDDSDGLQYLVEGEGMRKGELDGGGGGGDGGKERGRSEEGRVSTLTRHREEDWYKCYKHPHN